MVQHVRHLLRTPPDVTLRLSLHPLNSLGGFVSRLRSLLPVQSLLFGILFGSLFVSACHIRLLSKLEPNSDLVVD